MRVTRSLVSQIQYRPVDPDTLELWGRETGPITRLPGGVKLLERWRAICVDVS